MGILDAAVNRVEESLLNLLRDRATFAAADVDAIDTANRRHFRRGAAEEDLVGDVEHLARHLLLLDLETEIAGDGDDRVAGDAVQEGAVYVGRIDHAVLHDEDVLARALADHAVRRETDAFVVAVAQRFHLDELAAEIIAGDLGHRWNGVRLHARPAGDAGVGALFHRLIAEVGAPRPAGDVGL